MSPTVMLPASSAALIPSLPGFPRCPGCGIERVVQRRDVGQLPVHPGFDRRREVVHGAPVGHHIALESPKSAQRRLEQVLARARGSPVDLREGAHDGRRLRIPDRHFERKQVQLV